MAECECLPTCKVAAGAEAVPSDLFSSQIEKVSKILKSRK